MVNTNRRKQNSNFCECAFYSVHLSVGMRLSETVVNHPVVVSRYVNVTCKMECLLDGIYLLIIISHRIFLCYPHILHLTSIRTHFSNTSNCRDTHVTFGDTLGMCTPHGPWVGLSQLKICPDA